jgi:hypothetical protein
MTHKHFEGKIKVDLAGKEVTLLFQRGKKQQFFEMPEKLWNKNSMVYFVDTDELIYIDNDRELSILKFKKYEP